MAKEADTTKPEGTETDETEEEETVTTETTEEEEVSAEAEVEAGASDTVPRSEMVKAIKARQIAKAKLREKEAEIAALKAKNETESEKAVREAQEKTLKAATDKYKPALVKAGATAAILAAGPKKGKDGVARLLKLMDLDAIDLSEDNDLEGVEEEVMRLQEEYPELFTDGTEKVEKEEDEEEEEKPKTRRRQTTSRTTTSRSADGAGKKPAPKKKTTAEMIMAKMRGEE